ncbi:hypothetical protein GLP21_12075 [Photobacterium carnosum]|uniref:Uncharacterized protein n=1 Tax=Photobacterium carnosum TaxID=2023717 RepID=A0A2N4UW02_9GAMM|nr:MULTISPECIES: hypothetical protein [Photobacterium]MCD9485853.1 hypothetical protein [Photobacterium iliopiscarium]MCD9539514.1 hypothetical protein [Photobacterium carnosum]MCD9543208.1 hypothetical protein [Photobacterium carnosum]MCD9547001.1 hypothetical protein [Photobacterium carnosum]MCD9549365.1 hypothetical protein [Photobacterium carnosum]
MLTTNAKFETNSFNYKRNQPVINLVLDMFRDQGYFDIANDDKLSFTVDSHGYVTDIHFPEIKMSEMGFVRLMAKWFEQTKNIKTFHHVMKLKEIVEFVFNSKLEFVDFNAGINSEVPVGSPDWVVCKNACMFMDTDIDKIVKSSIKLINNFINNTTLKHERYLVKQHILTGCRVDVYCDACDEIFGLSKKTMKQLCQNGGSRLVCMDIDIEFYGLNITGIADFQSRIIKSQCGSSYEDIVKLNMPIIRDCLHEMVMEERDVQGLVKENLDCKCVLSIDELRAWRSLGID